MISKAKGKDYNNDRVKRLSRLKNTLKSGCVGFLKCYYKNLFWYIGGPPLSQDLLDLHYILSYLGLEKLGEDEKTIEYRKKCAKSPSIHVVIKKALFGFRINAHIDLQPHILSCYSKTSTHLLYELSFLDHLGGFTKLEVVDDEKDLIKDDIELKSYWEDGRVL